MIKDVLRLLKSSDFFTGDEDIDIAKGKYETPIKWSEFNSHHKRNKN